MEKETTVRTVGDGGLQTTLPKKIMKKYPNAKKVKWIENSRGKITVEILEKEEPNE